MSDLHAFGPGNPQALSVQEQVIVIRQARWPNAAMTGHRNPIVAISPVHDYTSRRRHR